MLRWIRDSIAFWQGLIDGTVQPRFWKQRARAPECLASWRGRLAAATAHLAALTEARTGLPAAAADIKRAAKRRRSDGPSSIAR